jgi:AhpD family alkylhydroperoxidase
MTADGMHPAAAPNPYRTWPEGYRAWKAVSDVVYAAGIDPILLNLVMVRASQVNGCAHCLDMHTTDALAAGEEPHRIHVLAAWRDTPWFTPAERAALELAEAVTRVGDGRLIRDDVVARAVEHHGELGYAKLLLALVVINGWNRVNIATHLPPRRRNERVAGG